MTTVDVVGALQGVEQRQALLRRRLRALDRRRADIEAELQKLQPWRERLLAEALMEGGEPTE